MKIGKQKSAFTLVELMIVIAIIGVLAATLLPRLQGAQERSRDSGRATTIKQTAAVLEVYYSDNSEYPSSPQDVAGAVDGTGNGCLSAEDGAIHPQLAALMKGNKAPVDPQKNNVSKPCPSTTGKGVYGYYAIIKNGIEKAGYVLTANMESYQNANFEYGVSAPNVIDANSSYKDFELDTKFTTESTTTDGPANSIYVEIG